MFQAIAFDVVFFNCIIHIKPILYIFIFAYIQYIHIYICFLFFEEDNISPMPFNSTKWKNWVDFLYTFIFLFLFLGTGMENISPIHFTFTKWKKLKWFTVLPNWKRISNRETEKKKGKKWGNFLYFSTYLTLFPQSRKHFIVAIYFHEVQKRLRDFLYLFIHISFHFQ